MFSIFARTFKTATRHDAYSPSDLTSRRAHPLTHWEEKRIDNERRRASMRNVGMW